MFGFQVAIRFYSQCYFHAISYIFWGLEERLSQLGWKSICFVELIFLSIASQKDNVANQREHLILLLANVHIRQYPKPDQQPKVWDMILLLLMSEQNFPSTDKYAFSWEDCRTWSRNIAILQSLIGVLNLIALFKSACLLTVRDY